MCSNQAMSQKPSEGIWLYSWTQRVASLAMRWEKELPFPILISALIPLGFTVDRSHKYLFTQEICRAVLVVGCSWTVLTPSF